MGQLFPTAILLWSILSSTFRCMLNHTTLKFQGNERKIRPPIEINPLCIALLHIFAFGLFQLFEKIAARILENGKVFQHFLVLICRAMTFSRIVRLNFSKSASSESILYGTFFQILIRKKVFSGRNWPWDVRSYLAYSSLQHLVKTQFFCSRLMCLKDIAK